jgi:hypothetical protein
LVQKERGKDMKVSKLWTLLFTCLVGGAALSGCVFSADVPAVTVPEEPGSLTVRWTIAGTTAAAQCAYYQADGLRLVLYDEFGATVLTTNAPCESFNVTIDNLSPGVYHADATLADAAENARSLNLPLNDLNVTSGTDLAVDIDFPPRSFL